MIDLALHELHQSLGGRLTEIGGLTAVAAYGDVPGELAALQQTAGVLDLSFRGRLCLTGGDRQRFLNGQVTNDVKALQPGQGCYAVITNHKGKIQGDLNIHALANELLLDFEPGQVEAVTQRLDQFIIADDVQVVNVAPHYGLLSVQGPQAARALAEAGLGIQPPAAEFQSVMVNHPSLGEICAASVARLGVAGFDLFVPVNSLGAVFEKLLAAAAKAGGRACGWQALEIARIEAGIPRFGVDMDDTNLAPEAVGGPRAISYAKGCYTGQEVIARIRTYGQVSKALRKLRLPDDLAPLPAKGDKLLKDGKEVGYLTSVAHSPVAKANVALGYVRRECNRPGTELLCGQAKVLVCG